MPAPFRKINLDAFAELLERFPFTRMIDAVHMHHTWRPDHAQFRGHDSIVGMWDYHTKHNGWSDIAQHITIDPQGAIWLGRDWNTPPTSAKGHNGTRQSGPFMFEMIGDFDVGRDKFAGKQREAVIAVIAMVQDRFGLPTQSLEFHNAMSGKTCPGSSINYQHILAEVERRRESVESRHHAALVRPPPFQRDSLESSAIAFQALNDMTGSAQRIFAGSTDDADACSHHQHDHFQPAVEPWGAKDSGRSLAQDLRPHLVNLTMGELSTDGEWTTSRAEVEAIFSDHLPRALECARAKGQPLRVMFQAHGGLNDEATGIAIARKSVAWWLENDIYPIYFAWETGLFESIGQLLRRAISGKRDLADYTTDPAIQASLRLLGAPKIWGVMKQSAQLASSPDVLGNSRQVQAGREGGAYFVAQQLGPFCKRHGNDIELHAVGHSAGSIFHSWFIPCALALGAPRFRSLHLMAPAMRVDLFKEKLGPLLGASAGIDDLTVYTMKDDLETDDTCAGIYRKSLLYLIFHALEPQCKTPLLGLEDNLRADSDLSRLFGIVGESAKAEVIWSRTQARQGRSASNATSHGGFDDDPSTMGSIARRILDRSDSDSIVEYTPNRDGRGGEKWASATVEAGDTTLRKAVSQAGQPPVLDSEIRLQPSQGVRRALCVGIDEYVAKPLAGCLADVESWSRSLKKAGFAVTRLLNQSATRAGIVESLERMIRESSAGDVLVFHYSGHGTKVPDFDGDEAGGDTPNTDEALIPYDYETGGLLLDDDLGRIYARVPDGVNMTCFMDCCHSGGNSRVLEAWPTDPSARSRFLEPDAKLIKAHRDRRQHDPAVRGSARMAFAEPEAKATEEVSFAACSSNEVAWESGGQGEFTVRATAILDGGFASLTNAVFIEKVKAAFGETARQHAQLDRSHRSASKRLLLQPLIATPVVAGGPPPLGTSADLGQIVELLQRVQQLLEQPQYGQGQQPPPGGKGKAHRDNGALQMPPPQSMQGSDQQNR
jgi:hypothetical protein